MRQNTKKKRSGFGYFIRMFLLLVELLAVTLFLWGNDAYSISATTPEFKWENYKTIAHALGGIGDKTYLNSKESFLAGYQMGCRLFEVDLVKTSDNVWVCRHSWYQSLGQWEGDEKKVLSSEEFLSRPIYGKYTPITFEDLLVLLSDYPDTFVMLDSKQYSVRNYQFWLIPFGARTVKLPVPKSNVSPTEGYCTIIAFAVAVFIKLLNKFEVCT